MNCFQISIFAVHEQPATGEKRTIMVVNCFQISIFAVHEQHIPANAETTSRCELLSN